MSFSDMMSSGRGPGVIGMVMALMVLLGFGLLFMYASNETDRVGQSIESLIAHQARDIEAQRENIVLGQQKLDRAPALAASAKEYARLKRDNQALQQKAVGLSNVIEAAKAEIALKLQELENYKNEYRAYARGKAKGQSMEKLETLTGVTYDNVIIREVTPIGIQIRHADGQKRIPFEELPEAMKDHFQFDPKQKDEALAAESATRKEHEAAVAVADGLAGQKMDEFREKEALAAKEKVRQEIAVKEGLIASLKEEIKGLEMEQERAAADATAARTAGRMHINKSGSIGANIRSKQNRIGILQAEVVQMKFRL